MSINLKSNVRNIVLLLLALLPGLMLWAVAQPAGSAQAQNEELLVTITQVDSQAFPQVMAQVTVSGQTAGLTAANFQLFENGAAIPATALTVEPETLPALSVVLALDVSMPPETLADLQTAAAALVNSLGAADRAAVIVFNEQVEVIQNFTNNKESLLAAINTLEPQGEASAVYEAAFQAAATAAFPGRKAVIILTNSADNLNQRSIEEAVAQAQSAQTPLYAIGLGPRAEPTALNTLAGQTGGQAFIFAGPGEVGATLQKIQDELRQGYRVTFQSGVQADGAEHSLTLNVVSRERVGQAETRFVATPGQVTVRLPGVVAGQTVTGTLVLAPEFDAPAPIARVEYRMDDRVLADVGNSPFSFRWDTSTVTAGEQTLLVRAVDQAGNVGQTETRLTVAAPLTFETPADRQEVALGEEVNLHIPIEAGAGVTHVEFLLDETVLGAAQVPSYRFKFNSGDHPPGEHTITIRVRDDLGQQAEVSYPIAFVAPPAALSPGWFATTLAGWWASLKAVWFNWWRTLLTVVVIGIFGVIILALVMVWLKTLRTWRNNRYYKKGHLTFRNRGNIPNRYSVRVADPVGALIFQLSLNGVALQPQPQPIPAVNGAAPAPAVPLSSAGPAVGTSQPAPAPQAATQPAMQPAAVAQTAPASPSAQAAGSQPRGVMEQAEDASQKARELTGIARLIIGMINMVAGLLPRSIGGPLRSFARLLYKPLMQLNRLIYLPMRFVRSSRQISKKMDKLHAATPPAPPGTSTATPPAASGPVGPPPAAVAAPTAAPGASSPAMAAAGNGVQSPAPPALRSETEAARQQAAGPNAIITPFIEPDEQLTLDLLIKPVAPYQSRNYVFTVTSKSLQEPEAEAITHQKNIHIAGVSLLRRYLPLVALLVVMITILVLVVAVGVLIVSLIL